MSPARIDTFALTNHLLFFYYLSSKKLFLSYGTGVKIADFYVSLLMWILGLRQQR